MSGFNRALNPELVSQTSSVVCRMTHSRRLLCRLHNASNIAAIALDLRSKTGAGGQIEMPFRCCLGSTLNFYFAGRVEDDRRFLTPALHGWITARPTLLGCLITTFLLLANQ